MTTRGLDETIAKRFVDVRKGQSDDLVIPLRLMEAKRMRAIRRGYSPGVVVTEVADGLVLATLTPEVCEIHNPASVCQHMQE